MTQPFAELKKEKAKSLFIGLDVHKEKISVALAEEGRSGEVRSFGSIDNTPDAVARLIKTLRGERRRLCFCYEASGCGYGVYRQIVEAGHSCEVVAPSRIPRPAGDRVKTDRRDALMLAKLHRSGELTAVWVPDEDHEAMRDLIRSRRAALTQRQMTRQQLQAFLLRHGRIYRGANAWTRTHSIWLSDQRFEREAHQIVFQGYVNAVHDGNDRLKIIEEQIEAHIPSWSMAPVVKALCALRGVSTLVAASILASTGDLGRFQHPRQLMSYFGLVPSEHSSGKVVRRGGITRTGNNEVRRVLLQSAWCYRFPTRIGREKMDAFAGGPAAVRQIAWKAQLRLTRRYRKLLANGKSTQTAITAIARELLGFVWAIGQIAKPSLAR
jgi:transposase